MAEASALPVPQSHHVTVAAAQVTTARTATRNDSRTTRSLTRFPFPTRSARTAWRCHLYEKRDGAHASSAPQGGRGLDVRSAFGWRAPAQLLQVGPHRGPDVGASQGGVDEGFHVAELVAGVVAQALELDRGDGRAAPGELADGVGEPDLAAAAGLELGEDVEDLRLQDIPVHGREIARSILRLGLLDDREHAEGPLVDRRARDDAVGRGLRLRDSDAADDASAAQPLPGLDELRERRPGAEDDVVPPEHREGLVAHERPGLQDGVPVPLRFLLDHRPHCGELLGALQELDLLLSEFHREAPFEAFVPAEVRVEGLLSGRDHDDDAGDPRGRHLAHDHLDDGRVDDREELLWHGAADGQEARAEPAGRDDAVADGFERVLRPRHGRASDPTVKDTGTVVRTAKGVTATSGGRRSPEVSRSRVSAPVSTMWRSTVGRSPKRSSCTR